MKNEGKENFVGRVHVRLIHSLKVNLKFRFFGICERRILMCCQVKF